MKGFTEALQNDLRLNAPHVRASVVMPGHIGTSIFINSGKVLGREPKEMTAEQVAELRVRLERGGIDVGGASDDDIRLGMQIRGEMFRDNAPTTAAQAATIILDGVRANEWRILVGDDAFALDELVRRDAGRGLRRVVRRDHGGAATSSGSGSDGVAMLYGDLVAASQRTAATSKRSEKVAALADLLRSTPPDEIPGAIGLLIGDPRQGRLGVGWATMSNLQVTPAIEPSLTIHDVDAALTRVAAIEGAGSQGERLRVMTDLWSRATEAEQNHLYRVLTGELRQGANEGVVADAVAKASGQPIAAVRRAAMLLGDLGGAACLALTGQSLDVGLTPLTAVQPMLAGTSTSVTEALAEIGLASVEWKLDGIRVQAHKRGDEVRLFSRGLNDITARVAGGRRPRSASTCDNHWCSTERRWGSTRTGSRGSSRRR